MQNKGAILSFAILLAAVCLYQLTFTWKAKQIEKDAVEYAQGDPDKEFFYLDSISGEEVYNFLGLKQFQTLRLKSVCLLIPQSFNRILCSSTPTLPTNRY